MSRVVWLDGRFVPESEAKLSIYDLSVMQAAAAFEMTRSFNGRHFKLREHLARLYDSCERLSIPIDRDVRDLEVLCDRVAQQHDHGPGEEHRLLIVASPGCAPMYNDLEGVIPYPFVYIADFPLRYTVQGFSKYFTEGVQCVTSPIQQVPDACVPSAAKHRSRLHFHLAQQRAPLGTWPLLTDADGAYTEAPGANLAMVIGGIVFTLEARCLPGISLRTVADLLPSSRGRLHRHDLDSLDELWLTGTPFCALPVTSLDGQPIGDGTIGPKYHELMAKWNALVGLDIRQQMKGWDDARRAHTNQY